MSYRKFYEQETGRKLPKNWDVHHIDFDRTNNSLDNLIAIPRELHKKYHLVYNEYSFYAKVPEATLRFGIVNNGHYRSFLDVLQRMSEVLNSSFVYLSYKEFLLGRGPYFINHLY